jgi:hypothetical protein
VSAIEETLTHELVHAFVHARTRGNAPHALHEGLAQYLSGRRAAGVIDTRVITPGARVSVGDFYEASLAFVEYLLRRRGQSGINYLLEELGTSGVDGAFGRVYGNSYAGVQAEWQASLR